jgi:hypothetical protein
MSQVHRDRATKLFTPLWGNDSQRWNDDQHAVAAGVDKLFRETVTITKKDLSERISQLLIEHPESYTADGTKEVPSGPRSALNRDFQDDCKRVMTDDCRSQDRQTDARTCPTNRHLWAANII